MLTPSRFVAAPGTDPDLIATLADGSRVILHAPTQEQPYSRFEVDGGPRISSTQLIACRQAAYFLSNGHRDRAVEMLRLHGWHTEAPDDKLVLVPRRPGRKSTRP